MRPEMLTKIHASHLGIEASLRKAKDTLFWPYMNTDIKEEVEKCETCNEYKDNQAKEPLMSHEVPNRPWSKLGLDLFTLHGKEYMVLVDYYSDYWEVDQLRLTTTAAIIAKLKPHFRRFGIPDELVTDNAPNLVSDEFAKFATEYEFKHITSSPYHSKSNGKAESAVKIVKKLLKRVQKHTTDMHKAILDCRNTPSNGMNTSPVQRLMSKRTKTGLPTSENLLKPTVVNGEHEQLLIKRQKAKQSYDKHAKALPELVMGQPVYVQATPNSQWQPGKIAKPLSPRSYIVDIGGKRYRRNHVHIRHRHAKQSGQDMPDQEAEPNNHSEHHDSGRLIQDNGSSDNTHSDNSPQLRRTTRIKKAPDIYQAGF